MNIFEIKTCRKKGRYLSRNRLIAAVTNKTGLSVFWIFPPAKTVCMWKNRKSACEEFEEFVYLQKLKREEV